MSQLGRNSGCLTRIVATVGPASSAPSTLEALLKAGVSVFRLNFSHGDLASHAALLRAIRAAESRAGRIVGVLADLPGPKIRVGQAPPEGIDLSVGRTVRIAPGAVCAPGDPPLLACTYAGIVEDAQPGHRVLIDDGAIRLLVTESRGDELVCATITGGVVRSGKGINLPDSVVRADPLTKRDLEGAAFATKEGVDFLGMSFVEDPADIHRLRGFVGTVAAEIGRTPPQLVAKIERPRAIERIEEIVAAADAVMVARGDLGVEMDLAKVPILQKRVLAAAQAEGRPAIVATQMLQSMVESPVPTRAEASDVATAIIDGCDAVMLSGETAMGKWPVLAVETMVRIAREAEGYVAARREVAEPPERLAMERRRLAAMAHGAARAARDLGLAAVAAWSQTGVTALLLSRYRFHVPIMAASTDRFALRRMRLLRGVEPVEVGRPPATFHDFTTIAVRRMVELGAARAGDLVLIASGETFGVGHPSAILALHEIGLADLTAAGPDGTAPERGGGGAA